MADTKTEGGTRQERTIRIMAIFDEGRYSEAAALVRNEQEEMLMAHSEEILKMLGKWKLTDPYRYLLLYHERGGRNYYGTGSVDRFRGKAGFFVDLHVGPNALAENPKRIVEAAAATTLDSLISNFRQRAQRKRDELESRLTQEGFNEIIEDTSFDFQIGFEADETAKIYADKAFRDFREAFRRLAGISLNYTAAVCDYCILLQALPSDAKVQNNLPWIKDQFVQLLTEVNSNPALSIIYPHFQPEVSLDVRTEGLEQQLNSFLDYTVDQASKVFEAINRRIAESCPDIQIFLKELPGEYESVRKYQVVVFNECTTPKGAVDQVNVRIEKKGPNDYVSLGKIGESGEAGVNVGEISEVAANKEPSVYAFHTNPFEVSLVGPSKRTSIKVSVSAQHPYFREPLRAEAEFDVAEPSGLISPKASVFRPILLKTEVFLNEPYSL